MKLTHGRLATGATAACDAMKTEGKTRLSCAMTNYMVKRWSTVSGSCRGKGHPRGYSTPSNSARWVCSGTRGRLRRVTMEARVTCWQRLSSILPCVLRPGMMRIGCVSTK